MRVTINGHEVELVEGDEVEVQIYNMDCGTWKDTAVSVVRGGRSISLVPAEEVLGEQAPTA